MRGVLSFLRDFWTEMCLSAHASNRWCSRTDAIVASVIYEPRSQKKKKNRTNICIPPPRKKKPNQSSVIACPIYFDTKEL